MIAREPTLVLAKRVRAIAPAAASADAVLIRDGVIAAVGRADTLRRAARRVRVLDLRPCTLTPGLADAHIHLVEWAIVRASADLAASTGPEDVVRRLRDAPPPPAGLAWLRGRGWNPHRWAGRRPHRTLLDAAFPDAGPIVLQSHDMHALWVNGAALRAAGIHAGSADPLGGRIERDDAGEPTGVLYDDACPPVIAALPGPPLAALHTAIEDAQAALHASGITAVHSFPGIHVPDPEPLGLLEELRARGRLRLRVLQHIRSSHVDAAAAVGLRSGFGGDWIRIGAVKFFLDGALGSRTAWMRSPYVGGDDRGIRVLEPEAFRAGVATAAAAGFASAVHAIGDAAVALAVDVLTDAALRVHTMPHRIEHVQCIAPDRLAGVRGVTCSVQPSHLITDWRAVDEHWGAERAAGSYAFASLLRAGALLAFGSDAPVEPVDPRRTLHAATLRQDEAGLPPRGWQPAERISRDAALHAMTGGPARAARWHDRLGSIAPGYVADLAAWDLDPIDCADDELLRLRCVATLSDGELVHSVHERV